MRYLQFVRCSNGGRAAESGRAADIQDIGCVGDLDVVDIYLVTGGRLRSAEANFGIGVSVGGELRANLLFEWAVSLQLRLGWGQVVHAPNPILDQSGPYFQIGSTF